MKRSRVWCALLALAAAGPAQAACIFTQASGRSSCADAVKDLLVDNSNEFIRVRLHNTDPLDVVCELPSGYWSLPTSDPNHHARFQLLLLSAASNLRVEIVSKEDNVGPCVVEQVRLVND